MRNITLILLVFLGLAFTPDAGAQEDQIYIIPVSDAIGPGVADFIKKGIDKATADRAACVLIELDTPGGLAESMRIIVMAIYGSKIPVVVYVAPSGARAASAGVMGLWWGLYPCS